MSVKRYFPGEDSSRNECAMIPDTYGMNGPYVSFADYAALLAERDKLREALQVIAIGDYDNAHDCKAASRVACAALSAPAKKGESNEQR